MNKTITVKPSFQPKSEKQTPRPPANVTPDVLLDTTLVVMEELTALMEEEVRLIKKADMDGVHALLKRKNSLVKDYQSNMAAIVASQGAIKACSAEKRARVKAAGLKLDAMTKRDAETLQGAISGIRFLIENIIKGIRAVALPEAGYGFLGKHSTGNGPLSERLCPAVSVRKSV